MDHQVNLQESQRRRIPIGEGPHRYIAARRLIPPASYPESTEAMGRGVDARDDGQGKANGPGPIPIDGDEGGVRLAHSYDDGGPRWRCWAKLSG